MPENTGVAGGFGVDLALPGQTGYMPLYFNPQPAPPVD
jgi:hypothetical protein